MLEDAEAGANPEALLRTVVGAVIELREAAHFATVPPTDYPDEETVERRKEKRKKRRRH